MDALIQDVLEMLGKRYGNAPLAADLSLFDTGLALDSFEMIDLLTAIEERYSVRFESAELSRENLATTGNLARAVAVKLTA